MRQLNLPEVSGRFFSEETGNVVSDIFQPMLIALIFNSWVAMRFEMVVQESGAT